MGRLAGFRYREIIQRLRTIDFQFDHPDKVPDQISDALIDNFLAFDPSSKVACETLVTTGQVVLAGEVKSRIYLDVQKIARE